MLLLLQIGEIVSRYQLPTLLPSRSALHIRQKFQWTYKQFKSAYLDLRYFHRRSSKFPAEHLSMLLGWFTPFFIAIIHAVQYFGSAAFIKSVNTVVSIGVNVILMYQFTVLGHVYLKLKREVSRREERFKIAIMFSGHRRRSREERNGFVQADVVK